MPDDRRDYDKDYETIMRALADSVLKESPEELANDLRAEGIDPDQYAEKLRKVMLDAVKAQKQQHLRTAQRDYEQSRASYEQRKVHLPQSPDRRRAIFHGLLQRNPELRQQLTLQNRDFTDLSDEDIDLSLKQLYKLGALTDDDLKDE